MDQSHKGHHVAHTTKLLSPMSNKGNQGDEPTLIHRSAHGMIFNNFQEEMKRKIKRDHDLKTKGWFSKDQVPYQQLGDFSNIIQALDTVKQNLPHTKQTFDDLTAKNLKFIKKVHDPHTQVLNEPGRTIKIMKQYQGQLRIIRAVSQLDQHTYPLNPIQQHARGGSDLKNHQVQGTERGSMSFGISTEAEELKYKDLQQLRQLNGSINSPSMSHLMSNSTDGRSVLKSEIADSNQRLMLIKHGMAINQAISAQQTYDTNSSMLPSEINYFSDRQQGVTNRSKITYNSHKMNDSTFITSVESTVKSLKANSSRDQTLVNGLRASTQMNSPLKTNSPRLAHLPSINGGSSVFNPDRVIYIPNFHHNNKPKIIKLSDLASVVPVNHGQESTTTINSANTASNTHANMSNRVQRKNSNDYFDISAINRQSLNFGHADTKRQKSLWTQKNNQANNSGSGNVNFHKKLKDEFERYERFIKESEEHIHASPIQNKNHIKQMIANSFLNIAHIKAQKKANEDCESLEDSNKNDFDDQLQQYQDFQMANSRARQGNLHPSNTRKLTMKTQHHILNGSSTRKKSSFDPKATFEKKKSSFDPQNSNVKEFRALNTITEKNHHMYDQGPLQKGSIVKPRLTRYERDQLLITSIINSIKRPNNDPTEEEEELLQKLSEDYLWKECSNLLKDYFKIEFLNEIKDNKQIMFRLYKLYLLHQLLLRMKSVEDNPNHPVNKKRVKGGAHSQLMASSPNGELLHYEEYSDDEMDGAGSDAGGEEGDSRKYRGLDKEEIYKHKMDGFIRLLQDVLNPAEIAEARELDSVFQLKSQVRSYYELKGELSDTLTETLYAMMQERPSIIESKKKYFFKSHDGNSNVKKIRNLYFELEQMRVNAERDRISTYREMVESLLNNATSSTSAKKQF